ncbi:ATP-binding protein [Burkholderia multivorans]|uniref:ATP-binding protein n=1 Tax=Burkholderia multivorans TaxID=87883 RepID=UPI001C95CFAD|nr:DUF87 domain-containing protein [Burkholderia multivorans]
MQIRWGSNAQSGGDVIWDSDTVVNPHIAAFADSGMGKTTMLRKIAQAMQETGGRRLRIHVFDAHGDVEIPGESAVRFHESADFGFNPLELNPDPEFGGVRKRIQSLIAAINRTSVRLGPRQERALTKLLTGLYRRHGFFADDASTWAADAAAGKRYPTLPDAIEYGRERLKEMYVGSDERAVQAFQEVERLARQVRAKEVALARLGNDEALTKLQRDLENAKEKAIDVFREAVLSIHTGDELDRAIESDGQEETIKSVLDRLENLYAIGIYRSTPPPLDPRCRVWRYIITSLSPDEKKLFTITRLETIFSRAVQRGAQSDIVDVCMIDEAHLYQDKDEDYIINKMVREGRKFGISMVFASQALTDFADVLISSLGTKLILGIDRNYWRAAIGKFGVPEAALKFIVPHRRIVVQMKSKGELNAGAYWVAL